jgi:NAD-dependent DNA ligase
MSERPSTYKPRAMTMYAPRTCPGCGAQVAIDAEERTWTCVARCRTGYQRRLTSRAGAEVYLSGGHQSVTVDVPADG